MPNYRNLNLKNTITPKNFKEYKKILLLDETKFKKLSFLNKNQILTSKYILFIRENIHYLKKDLNGFEILRKDSDKIKKENFNLIFQQINKNIIFLKRNAELLNKNNSHTISSKFIKFFIN